MSNQYTAIGSVKPGLFRRWLVTGLLVLIDYAARHVFTRGFLARVQTIHFAFWAFLDDKRRLVFTSNYDGGHEAYMDDFINKVAWGLNLAFSHGVGWPRTRWLVARGARIENKFKNYQRRHQLPTEVWYKAYPGLTLADLKRNQRIREGLEPARVTDAQAAGLAAAAMSARLSDQRRPVELDDVQGLVRFGYKHLTEACFLLLRVKDRGGRAGLARGGAGDERSQRPIRCRRPRCTSPSRARGCVHWASPRSLRRVLGRIRRRHGERRRARAPPGRCRRQRSGRLALGRRRADAARRRAALCRCPGSSRRGSARSRRNARPASSASSACRRPDQVAEPFGFADGISQPKIDWERERPVRDQDRLDYDNLVCLGEFLLGYPNEYGALHAASAARS